MKSFFRVNFFKSIDYKISLYQSKLEKQNKKHLQIGNFKKQIYYMDIYIYIKYSPDFFWSLREYYPCDETFLIGKYKTILLSKFFKQVDALSKLLRNFKFTLTHSLTHKQKKNTIF